MKNIYLGLGVILSAMTANAQSGQIPNAGFENWSTEALFEAPDQWFSSNENGGGSSTVSKSADAQLGSFSAELYSAGDEGFAYTGLGEIINGPSDGIPYTGNFTTVKFWYKSDFQTNDSIYVYVIRYLGGTQVGEYVGGAAAGTQSTWTEGTFTVPAGSQDKLFIAFLTASPQYETNNSAGSWFRVDNVRLFDGATQRPALPNFSLENWSTEFSEEPTDWYTLNFLSTTLSMPAGTTKSTDAHSGTSAVQLKTNFSEAADTNIPGLLSLTSFNGNPAEEGIPYNAIPSLFSGWYKFIASGTGEDLPSVDLFFFRNGEVQDEYYIEFDAAAAYTEFTVPVNITEQPDSINVVFYSGEFDGATLTIDDLSFSGGTVSVEKFAKSNLSVYPNPASEKVMIKAEGSYSWEIITLSGNTVLTGETSVGAQEINVSQLNAGTYFIRLNGNAASDMHKLVIQ